MRRVLALGMLLVVGCERSNPKSDASTKQNPIVVDPIAPSKELSGLVPRIEELRALAKDAPPELTEAQRTEVKDLLEAAFAGADESVSTLALRRIDRMDDRQRAFEDGLSHSNPDVRAACADALRERGDVSSLPALILRMRVEQDARVKLWIAAAMFARRNHSAPAVNVLIQSLDDTELSENAGAIALEAFAAAKLEIAPVPTWDDVRQGLRKLQEHWEREGYALGSDAPPHAKLEDLEPRLRAQLASYLVQLSEFQLRPVDYAREVLRRLGVLPLPLLEMSLSASESYVRAHVVEIVRDIGRPARTLRPTIEKLIDDPLTRLSAVQALGRFGEPSAAERVRPLLVGEDLDLALAAAESLGEMGDTASRDALLGIVQDEKALLDLRVYAAFGLARLDGGGAGEAFLRARLADKTYHEPTLNELLERLAKG